MALLQTTPLQQILQSNALLASAIRLKYPFLKLLQANVLSPLEQPSIWNGPDNIIKHSSSLKKFKASMKEYVLTQCNL